jgi:hypothetical protein
MKLPLLSGRQVLATLQRLGFAEIHRKAVTLKWSIPMDDESFFISFRSRSLHFERRFA